MAPQGSTFALYGGSGSGKTTQVGEYALYVWQKRGKKTLLNSCDRGGYASIQPLVDAGIIEVNTLKKDDNPWVWINAAIQPIAADRGIGVVAYDSGTSMGEILLNAAAESPQKIGQQETQRFVVSKDQKVALNNMAHYGLVQNFWSVQHRAGTWMIEQGIDIVWTFLEQRSEAQDLTNVIGPKLVGKALTAGLPKEFNYTFRLEAIPREGADPIHRLYLKKHTEFGGVGEGMANARYPLHTTTKLPPFVEPADMGVVLALLEKGQQEEAAYVQSLTRGGGSHSMFAVYFMTYTIDYGALWSAIEDWFNWNY